VQASKDLILLETESLFSKERNKTLELLNTGKMFKKGFDYINSTDEIYYGSALGDIST